MYQHSYAEVMEDDQAEARRNEAYALDHAYNLLMEAAARPHPSVEGVKALYFTRRLWMLFVTELAAPDNALSNDLKMRLISIGKWVLREADRIRLNQSTDYAGIAEICAIIRDGLR